LRFLNLEPSNWSRAEGEFGGDLEEFEDQQEQQQKRTQYYAPVFTVAKQGQKLVQGGKITCDSLVIGLSGAGACFVESAFTAASRTAVASLILPEVPMVSSTSC